MEAIVAVATFVGAAFASGSKRLITREDKRDAIAARAGVASLAIAIASIGLAVAPSTASAAGDAPEAAAKLRLGVSVNRFVVRHGDVVARGPVVARAVRTDGTTDTVRERVHLKVKTTRRCRILKLHLAPLFLNLLGLEVRTSTINLKITGDPRRTLGSLFCRLSRGIKLGRHRLAVRTARSLTRRLHDRPLRVLSVKAPLRAQGATATTGSTGPITQAAIPPPSPDSCEVLDLLLGPLHLDLLGLIVDLYGERKTDPVRVHITADPNGGLLGSLLCPSSGP
jgi:hypothetical protein